jgi:hypothetical protein
MKIMEETMKRIILLNFNRITWTRSFFAIRMAILFTYPMVCPYAVGPNQAFSGEMEDKLIQGRHQRSHRSLQDDQRAARRNSN